jgi:hypothetical protein
MKILHELEEEQSEIRRKRLDDDKKGNLKMILSKEDLHKKERLDEKGEERETEESETKKNSMRDKTNAKFLFHSNE